MQRGQDTIIVALDVPSESEAIDLARTLSEHIGFFKVGIELIYSAGFEILNKLSNMGLRLFLDVKFNDIPNTVAGAVRAVTRMDISIFNVHTLGGLDMMKAAMEATVEEASALGKKRPLVLGVTVLTSLGQEAMNQQLRIPGSVQEQVVHLASLAHEAGLDGVVASPNEIEAIRQNVSNNMMIVTPGVRPLWASAQDQKRVMTPGEAIRKGASHLVIGRPIIRPPVNIGKPAEAARLVANEIDDALEKG